MSKAIEYLLSSLEIHPVLVDIGASGTPPDIWQRIASHSCYVGFDPDAREIHEEYSRHFWQSTIVNKAIVAEEGASKAIFFLTASPYCSSTLEPDHASLSHYLFANLFTVEKQVSAPATSFNAVIERLSLPTIDWFKTDSQGTDLRLFNSLKPELKDRVLAIDIEPGLIDAYVGEDLFIDAHREFIRAGYWLSDIKIRGSVRMRRESLPIASALNRKIDEKFIRRTVKPSPGWCEARYLRSIEWLSDHEFAQREYVLLWVFAILDKQLGFAFDLAVKYEEVFGQSEISKIMKNEPLSLMQKRFWPSTLMKVKEKLTDQLRKAWRR